MREHVLPAAEGKRRFIFVRCKMQTRFERIKTMKLTGNTIFITGGGSGIGRALAEAFHKLGNQVIISGRRKSVLEATTKANPGMASIELDLENLASIQVATRHLTAAYPKLNVLINNAGRPWRWTGRTTCTSWTPPATASLSSRPTARFRP